MRKTSPPFAAPASFALRAAAFALFLAVLAGCAENRELRLKTAAQDHELQTLRDERNQYKKAYYDFVAVREKEIEAEKAARAQIERDMEKLRAESAQERQLLTGQIRSLEAQAKREIEKRQETERLLGDQVAGLQAQIETANQKLAALEETRKALEGERDSLKSTLAAAEQAKAQLTTERDSLRQTLESTKAELAAAREALAAREKELAEARAALEESQGRAASFERELARMKTQPAGSPSVSTSGPGAASLGNSDAILKEFRAILEKTGAAAAGGSAAAEKGGVVARLPSDWLFTEKSVLLAPGRETALAALAEIAARYPQTRLRVEGHTDDTPVQTLPFPDNWGVASARADAVARWLETEGKIPGARLESTGRSSFAPLDTANTPEARRRNRRVEIWLLP